MFLSVVVMIALLVGTLMYVPGGSEHGFTASKACTGRFPRHTVVYGDLVQRTEIGRTMVAPESSVGDSRGATASEAPDDGATLPQSMRIADAKCARAARRHKPTRFCGTVRRRTAAVAKPGYFDLAARVAREFARCGVHVPLVSQLASRGTGVTSALELQEVRGAPH